MIAAILFDRYYLKKFNSGNSNNASDNAHRVITSNPVLLTNATGFNNQLNRNENSTNLLLVSEISHSNVSLNFNNRNFNNDFPPQYLDTIKHENVPLASTHDASSNSSNLGGVNQIGINSCVSFDSAQIMSSFLNDSQSLNINETINDKGDIELNDKYQLPPNYFDLYPSSSNNNNNNNYKNKNTEASSSTSTHSTLTFSDSTS
jgi:hypothetical protein